MQSGDISMIPVEILQIVRGVPKAVGDTNSAEQDLEVFPLVRDGKGGGLTLDVTRGWNMALPTFKNSQSLSSPYQDGRVLTGEAKENVLETMNLIATDGNLKSLASNLAELSRLADRARAFHSTFHEIEPVYLEFAASGGYGSQYALIYNIEFSAPVWTSAHDGTQGVRLVITIEREPAWRGIPPGANPRLWTYEWRGKRYTFEDLNVDSTSMDALLEATINNRCVMDYSTDNYEYPSVAKNYVSIPSADIPGDAPALVMLSMNGLTNPSPEHDPDTGENPNKMYVSRWSKPSEYVARDGGGTRQLILGFPVTDGNVTVGSRQTDNTNGCENADTGTIEVVRTSSTNLTSFIPDAVNEAYTTSLNLMRGRFNVWLFGAASGGSVTAVNAFTAFRGVAGTLQLPTVNLSTSTTFKWNHLGVITLPFTDRSLMGHEGLGLSVNDKDTERTDLRIQLTISSTGDEYEASILVLQPFDEASVELSEFDAELPNLASYSFEWLIYDSSGYYSRNKNHATAQIIDGTSLPGVGGNPVTQTSDGVAQGAMLTLLPGQDNVLQFLSMGNARDDFNVEIDIVPRWYGVRDA